jgi:tetratricopeptide (TPR) repeat protein
MKGEYDEAIEDYNAALRLDPEFAAAYYFRGLSWSEKGEQEEASEDFRESMRLDPKIGAPRKDR